MKFTVSKTFEKQLNTLPESVRRQFVKQKDLLSTSPRHPSLHFKKLKDMNNTYSIRIAGSYRALFILDTNTAIFFAVGHRKDIYR